MLMISRDPQMCADRCSSGSSLLDGGVPQAMLGEESLHLDQLDVGVLGPAHGPTSNPPVRTGQACRQVCARPGIMSLLRPTTPRNDFAVSRLPKADRPRLSAKQRRHTSATPLCRSRPVPQRRLPDDRARPAPSGASGTATRTGRTQPGPRLGPGRHPLRHAARCRSGVAGWRMRPWAKQSLSECATGISPAFQQL
jgi:hypothetical protein